MCPRTDRLGVRGSSMGLHWAGIGVRVESIGAWRAGVSSPAVLSGRIVVHTMVACVRSRSYWP